jgi:hypothetical protein
MVEINKNEKYRKYLVHYPFTINDIRVVLYIMKPDYSPFVDPELSEVFLDKGVISYRTVGKDGGYKNEAAEPYAKAVSIFKGT